MSSNNDNAMTRFLFAILKQKNLKDIDWNKVAHDPVLTQVISNGHAARMRYSRFRAAMLGTEPTRRTPRTSPPKSKVTKSKKNTKTKNDDSVKSETSTAPESAPVALPSPPQQQLPVTPQKIKQEDTSYNYNNRMTPALTPSPVSVPPPISIPTATMIQNRFLTPCSDTDTFSPSPVMTSSPVDETFHSCDPTWAHGSSYFAAALPFEDYSHATCDPRHLQHSIHPQYHLGLPCQSIETGSEPEFKREWSQFE